MLLYTNRTVSLSNVISFKKRTTNQYCLNYTLKSITFTVNFEKKSLLKFYLNLFIP